MSWTKIKARLATRLLRASIKRIAYHYLWLIVSISRLRAKVHKQMPFLTLAKSNNDQSIINLRLENNRRLVQSKLQVFQFLHTIRSLMMSMMRKIRWLILKISLMISTMEVKSPKTKMNLVLTSITTRIKDILFSKPQNNTSLSPDTMDLILTIDFKSYFSK